MEVKPKIIWRILIITWMLIIFAFYKCASQELRIPDNEYFINRISAHYHFKETQANEVGLNYAIEAGYSGFVYALVGIESFQGLKGAKIGSNELKGYTDFHATIGFNLVSGYNEEWKYNAGIRLVKAYRGKLSQGYFRPFIGWEAGLSRDINEIITIGIRGTLDHRNDMEIFDWPVKNVFSSYLTLTFKIKQL